MLIKEVSIENFKGIDSLKFKPKLLNIIVGRNNTGKTSILEAIAMAFDSTFLEKNYSVSPTSIINYLANSGEISLTLSDRKGSNPILIFQKINENDLFKIFSDRVLNNVKNLLKELNSIKKSRELKTKISKINLEPLVIQDTISTILKGSFVTDIAKKLSEDCVSLKYEGGKTIFVGGEEFRTYEEKITISVIEKVYERNTKEDIEYLTYLYARNRFVHSPVVTRQAKRILSEMREIVFVNNPVQSLNNLLRRNEGNQELALYIEYILKRDYIIPNLTRFDFTELIFDTMEGRKSVKFNRMGEGFQTLVAILAILRSNEDTHSIFLMEEPEVHMHPGYVSELVKYLAQISSSLNVQFFITTHSYDLVQSLFDQENTSLREFLEKHLLLLRLNRVNDAIIGENKTYKEAINDSSDLLLDLRGI